MEEILEPIFGGILRLLFTVLRFLFFDIFVYVGEFILEAILRDTTKKGTVSSYIVGFFLLGGFMVLVWWIGYYVIP